MAETMQIYGALGEVNMQPFSFITTKTFWEKLGEVIWLIKEPIKINKKQVFFIALESNVFN